MILSVLLPVATLYWRGAVVYKKPVRDSWMKLWRHSSVRHTHSFTHTHSFFLSCLKHECSMLRMHWERVQLEFREACPPRRVARPGWFAWQRILGTSRAWVSWGVPGTPHCGLPIFWWRSLLCPPCASPAHDVTAVWTSHVQGVKESWHRAGVTCVMSTSHDTGHASCDMRARKQTAHVHSCHVLA